MRKLIVGNVDNEAMIGDTNRATLPLRQVSAIAARRLVWQLGEQDIAVLPSLVSEPMMAYVAETIGRKLLSSQVISPAMDLVTPVVLTSDVLLSEVMLSAKSRRCRRRRLGGSPVLLHVIDWDIVRRVTYRPIDWNAELHGAGRGRTSKSQSRVSRAVRCPSQLRRRLCVSHCA